MYMVLGSEYVAMPSCASAALSPIGLCKVVLRAGSRAGTVTQGVSPENHRPVLGKLFATGKSTQPALVIVLALMLSFIVVLLA